MARHRDQNVQQRNDDDDDDDHDDDTICFSDIFLQVADTYHNLLNLLYDQGLPIRTSILDLLVGFL